MEFLIDSLASPIGEIRLVSDGTYLRALDFEDYQDRMALLLKRHYGEVSFKRAANPAGATAAVRNYIEGDLAAIDEIKVKSNGSEFQELVWRWLRKIPAGKTWSYGELANAIGKPNASRAVGLANGSNPIAIVVPCHRVIGANGTLTGYGGGLARKQWLLEHEGFATQQSLVF